MKSFIIRCFTMEINVIIQYNSFHLFISYQIYVGRLWVGAINLSLNLCS